MLKSGCPDLKLGKSKIIKQIDVKEKEKKRKPLKNMRTSQIKYCHRYRTLKHKYLGSLACKILWTHSMMTSVVSLIFTIVLHLYSCAKVKLTIYTYFTIELWLRNKSNWLLTIRFIYLPFPISSRIWLKSVSFWDSPGSSHPGQAGAKIVQHCPIWEHLLWASNNKLNPCPFNIMGAAPCLERWPLIYSKNSCWHITFVIWFPLDVPLLILDIGIMVIVFANSLGDLGSITGRVIPKTQKNGTWCYLA